jgi:outer membrane protein TolC
MILSIVTGILYPGTPGTRPAHRRRRVVPAVILAVLVSTGAARAQEAAPSQTPAPGDQGTILVPQEDYFLETNPDSALAKKLGELQGTPLSLEEALHLAVDGSTDIREAADALVAAEGAVRNEKGAFDPELFLNAGYSKQETPVVSPFQNTAVQTKETTVSTGARIELPIGTELEASLNTTKTQTNNFFTLLDPQYATFGALSVRQPLLSGFGPSARADLSSAERSREAAQARYNEALLSVASRVEGTYWDVYAAERDLAVTQLIRDRAEAFLKETEVRRAAGLAGASEIATARVFLAQQELAVLDGQERLDQTSDLLGTLIGKRPEGGTLRYLPQDSPPRDFPAADVDTLITEALRGNRNLIAANANVEGLRALARGAWWDALPQLDLVGSLGGNGLAGASGDSISGGFGQTWAQVRDRIFPTWSVGLELTIPIGMREGRGDRARLKGQVAQAEAQYESASRSLREQVRSAYREVEHGSRRIAAAQDGVDASLEQVRIGLIEYRNGRTTAFELVRLGADLAAAQQNYSEALVRTAKAAAELRHLTSGAYPGDGTR